MNIKRIAPLAFASLLLMCVVCLSGCGRSVKSYFGGNDSTQTELSVDSFVFSENVDSMFACRIVADYPDGDDSLSLGVRSYIVSELERLCGQVTDYGDGMPIKRQPKYNGRLDDGKAVVAFFGKLVSENLRQQYDDMKQYSEIAVVVPSLSFDLHIRKTAETARYVTYESDYYSFLGGAHGSTVSSSAIIAKATCKVVDETVDTLKVNALQSVLRKGVLSYLRHQGDTTVTEKNLFDYLFVENATIPLPASTPCLTASGVHFVYQQYEIGPYAMGMVEFTIPYSTIRPFLTKQALELVK